VVNEESPDAQEGSGAATMARPTLFHQLPGSFSVMIAAHDFDRQPTRGILQERSQLTVLRYSASYVSGRRLDVR
jgi:hypothetical protein